MRRTAAAVLLVAALLVAGAPSAGACPDHYEVTRIYGPDRIATAIAISRAGFPGNESAYGAVLVRADQFADALSATPFAIVAHIPLLLTWGDKLDGRVADELRRSVRAGGDITLMGGPAALSAHVDDDVRALGFTTDRVAGADRFETAVAMAHKMDGPGNQRDTVFLATGDNYPDGVVAGAVSSARNAVVVLSDDQRMPASTYDYVRNAKTVYAFGDQAAAAYPQAIPITGPTRYDTAAKAATTFFGDASLPMQFGVATGENFPDALAGGSLSSFGTGPVLLTTRDQLPPPVEDYIWNHVGAAKKIFIYGDEGVVSQAVSKQIEDDVYARCGF